MRPLVVTGGTGTLGRAVVAQLRERGQDVRVLSRRAPQPESPGDVEWMIGDLRTGAGLEEAVRDAVAIVHCATDVRAPRHDLAGTRNLIAAARGAGRPHLVYVSIVGVDRVPMRYYQIKLDVERLVESCGLPWSILRATQFHDLVVTAARALARLPVMIVPAGTCFQPVDVRDVAVRLADLALTPPTGRAPDLGGPEVRAAADLAHMYLRATGRRRLVVPVLLPGQAARGYRHGGHLTPGHTDGHRSFQDYLAERGASQT